jgi:N-acetylmuramic acid 6-phosphate etherase
MLITPSSELRLKTTQSEQTLRSRKLSPTESRNPRSINLDTMTVAAAVELMLSEEAKVTAALLGKRALLARAVDAVTRAFRSGGRLFYFGAGTSGRLGVLDASECPPTFRVGPTLVQGIIAGGDVALRCAVEGAEDNATAGAGAVRSRRITKRDVVVGIAASGTTPYIWGALDEAKKRGATTLLVCFNPHLVIPRAMRPTLVIAADLGPEVLTGSTRLKAGTATKLVLNILTTLSMVQLGKVKSNLMVDLNPSNVKLRARAVRIVRELTGVDEHTAIERLKNAGWVVKKAVNSPDR